MPGSVSFLELGAPQADVDQSRAFFAKVFGWQFHPMPQGGGWFQTPTIRVGLHANDPAAQIYVFFEVADLPEAMAMVRAAGGEAEPSTAEAGFGAFSICLDPQGIRFGLHQMSGKESAHQGIDLA